MNNARERALDAVSSQDVVDWWTTGVADIEPGEIRLRGYPVEELIGGSSFVETIWLMVRGDLPTLGQAWLLEKALVAAVDHGPQAPSIAAARMAATCGVGLQGAISTGVGLLGDVHGGAGQQCAEILVRLANEAMTTEGTDPTADLGRVVATELAAIKTRRAYVPGFGHRFHPHDPRRDPLIAAVEEAVARGDVPGRYLAVALEVERQLSLGRKRPVPMNIDGATAVIYAELGFPPALSRGLFILSRSVGVLAHSWEEMNSGQRIKGPIPPPLLPTYDGPGPRAVPTGARMETTGRG